MAALVDTATGLTRCTGTLIGCATALTAAQCGCDLDGNPTSCAAGGWVGAKYSAFGKFSVELDAACRDR